MAKLILNEKKFVEDLLLQKDNVKNLCTSSQMLVYLSRYYYPLGIKKQEFIERILKDMMDFNYSSVEYQEYKAAKKLDSYYKALEKGKMQTLKDIDYIPLYKEELDEINKCETDIQKKMMFTIYILARFTNKYGWVYQSRRELFKLANISNTGTKKTNVIHELYKLNFIKLTNKIDDNKLGIDLKNEYTNEVLKIYDIENLGNQYITFIKPEYTLCEVCKKLIKIKSKYSNQKYCKQCAEKLHMEQDKMYQFNKRKANSSTNPKSLKPL